MKSKNAVVLVSLLALAPFATAASVTITNSDFQTDLNQANTVATGWTAVDGTGTNNAPSNYFANDIPNLTGNRVALIKSDGGNYIQQAITTSDQGAVTASTFNEYTVNFNYGYRRDGARNGDHTLRFSLWNTTDNVEITGSNLVIADPLTTGANSLSAGSLTLAYDSSLAALLGDSIALRVTSMSGDLGGSAWQRTDMVDGFSVSAVPEPSTYGLMGAGALAAVALVRRRRKAA